MSACPDCSAPLPPDATACPRCGAALDRTVVVPGATDATRVVGSDATGAGSAGSSPAPDDRFAPGTVIAGRYRVVALLGRGGMGEVYRADDLKLGQSVALKFLPRGLEADPDRLQRFLAEVRTARQVSHPNVCRVHDVDEFEGQHFLSMEYVDGEDLSSLLRRIGRLPEERAVEVARQICGGLAGAHEAGVLHRDLKPANVMLDGRGQVKLTDFGLASLAADAAGTEVRAGTPAYMAPEQIAGRDVSVRSDVYALGLVLYELFTGRATFQADTVAELGSMHASVAPSRPTTHVTTLDPAIERAVLRCLEKDPRERPPSAHAVAAALPGGDPLAAAIAAGETPSPELVAEAGARESLSPASAFGLAVLGLFVLVAGSYWAATMSWIAYVPFDKRPEVLQDRAVEILAELGYTGEAYADPVDESWGWLLWNDVMRQVAADDSTAGRWEAARERPDVGGFWYRQSPGMLQPGPDGVPVLTRGRVALTDPLPSTPGEVSVLFDLDGTLRRFEVMPRRFTVEDATEPDWTPLFESAGFDTSRFRSVEPRYARFQAPDLRRAWLGTPAATPDIEYRIEAGASEGRPILFNVAEATSLEDLAAPPERMSRGTGILLAEVLPGLMILVVVILVATFGSRNVEGRSVDSRGAWRAAVAIFVMFLVSEVLRSHELYGWGIAAELWNLIAAATFVAVVSFALYVAVEPLARRVWPSMCVSMSRLLSREKPTLRDPLLGRSVLAGMISAGVVFTLLVPGVHWVRGFMGDEPLWPMGINLDLVHGGRVALAQVLNVTMLIGMTFVEVGALVVIQRVVKRRWLAVALAVVVWTLIEGTGSPLWFGIELVRNALFMFVLLRFGILALVVANMAHALAFHSRAVDYTHWTSEGAVMAVVVIGLLAVYGAWAATGRATRAA